MCITIRIFILLSIYSILSCTNKNYNKENYQGFKSMDTIVEQIVQSIKTQDENKLLNMLDNEALIFDLLNYSTGKDAKKTKAYLATKEGKLNFSREQMSKKQRINAFLTDGLKTQINLNTKVFRSTGFELQSEKPFSEGSSATIQSYRIMLNNDDKKNYSYDIKVIYWYNKYHLIETAGFLNM
ncbi:MAG: hypothetical protein MK207_01795 [Saprospiraceae bacterium]|nr:hypothetical protein [Saprospiraceae bacterium]